MPPIDRRNQLRQLWTDGNAATRRDEPPAQLVRQTRQDGDCRLRREVCDQIVRERPQLARSEYRRGVAAMKVGDYATALAAFKYGYAVSARPGFLFNIAQCYRNLGRYREAAAVLESYRPYAPAERGAAIDALLCQLEKLARQQPAR